MKGPAVLKPILPSRYDRFSPRNLSRTPVDDDTPIHVRKSASPPSNRTLTRQALTHPEGGIVYVDERVVSPLPIDEDSWDVGSEVLRQCSDLGDDETTVFIQPRGSDFEYYIVDHSCESIFWIDGQLPDELRIDGQLPGELHGRANYRLNNILAEEYWVHIEAFPSSGSVSIGSVTRLKNVLSGLAIDSVSSDGSTSPFTFEQIRDFLGVLNLFNKQEDIDECQTYVVARIWSMIWHARVINNFGSLEACLHRLSYLSIYPPTFTGVKGILASVTLGAAEKHLDRCSRAWAGRIAYVGAWREFKAKNETEWKQAVQLASVMAVVSLLLPGYSSSKPFNMVPTLLSLSAVACGYYLVTESQSLDNHAAAACVYFRLWEKPGYGLQRVALRNSAPQALLSWALISLVGASIAFPQQGA